MLGDLGMQKERKTSKVLLLLPSNAKVTRFACVELSLLAFASFGQLPQAFISFRQHSNPFGLHREVIIFALPLMHQLQCFDMMPSYNQ